MGPIRGDSGNGWAVEASKHPHRRLSHLPEQPTENAWARWKRFATRAATFQARVLLTAMYWLVVAPFALMTQACGDPLHLSPARGGHWTPLAAQDPRRQS